MAKKGACGYINRKSQHFDIRGLGYAYDLQLAKLYRVAAQIGLDSKEQFSEIAALSSDERDSAEYPSMKKFLEEARLGSELLEETRLGSEIQQKVDLLFSAAEREAATRLLVELQVSFSETDEGAFGLERVQSAALRVSHGHLDRLRKAIAVGQSDFRDLLSAAGFGSPEAHKKWIPEPGEGSWWERWREGFFGIR